ncbi:MAG TPA: hypothetical protein PKK43_04905, partial [Spirochaetota bacterium]|nr:hypothetical protein [Spirochaetota bacterium]
VYAKSESREIDSVIQTATRKGTIRKMFLNYSRDVVGNKTTSCRYFDIYPDGKKVLVYVYEVLPDLYVDADGVKWVKTVKANGYILSRWYDEGMFRFYIWKSYDTNGVLQSHSAEKKKRAQVTYSEVSIVTFKASGEINKIKHITYTYYWTGNTVTIIQNVDGEIQPVSVAESNYGYTIIAYGMLYRVEFYPGSIIRISYKDKDTGADIVADVKVSADGTYSVTYNTTDPVSLDLKNVFGN